MDKATAQEHLDVWLAADKALATSQSYSIGSRTLTRADSDHVASKITYWNRIVDGFNTAAKGGQSGVLVPRFR